MALNAKTMTNKELFYGHKACPGCGAALAIRLALKVLGERTIAVMPPNCMSTVAFIYPHMPLRKAHESRLQRCRSRCGYGSRADMHHVVHAF